MEMGNLAKEDSLAHQCLKVEFICLEDQEVEEVEIGKRMMCMLAKDIKAMENV